MVVPVCHELSDSVSVLTPLRRRRSSRAVRTDNVVELVEAESSMRASTEDREDANRFGVERVFMIVRERVEMAAEWSVPCQAALLTLWEARDAIEDDEEDTREGLEMRFLVSFRHCSTYSDIFRPSVF